jgi:TetR/AcrR family transcriptional regulator of autoinduction and epiphytic fitness
MSRQLTPRGMDRKRQLMDFAARRFAEGGYHPTSVAEIVQGMGVGKGVFYWYFDSKESLLLEILKEAQTSLRRAQQAAIGDEPDPVRRIESGIRASMHWLDEHRHLSTLTQFAATEETFAPVLRQGAKVAVADIVRHVKEAVAQGRVADADPEVLALCILGVTDQLSKVLLLRRSTDPDEVADSAIAFCLAGLTVGVSTTPAL